MSDLVARLRRLSFHAKHLADNENLHALYVDAFQRCEQNEFEAANEIERLTKERDEARRMVCRCQFTMTELQHDYAKDKGWDCFERETE
jgi:uncharacterized protein involved in type VI secretion and phage assembly